MSWILLFYFLAAAAGAGLLIRFFRLRANPGPVDDRAPGPGTGILPEEWDRVRRDHCLPTQCPRTIGNPPRPRKDSHCEICAAMFLQRYWTRLLGSAGAAEPDLFSRRTPDSPPETEGEPAPHPIRLELPLIEEPSAPAPPARGRRAGQRGHHFLLAGALLFLAGILLSLPQSTALIGYTLCLIGVACLLRGAAGRLF